ncbi:MAG: PAS domain S-box protein [Nitrospirae bacterium]|nr:PAS domain S-box protein [Nitrospirota bacterium]
MEEKKSASFSNNRLINYLIEKICPFNVRTFQTLVIVTTLILLGAVLILGLTSSKKVKEIVTNDFNQQQLVLARHAARQIENNINILKQELSLLSLSPSIQYIEKVSIGNRMGITFSSIREQGILEIRSVEYGKTNTHVVDSHGHRTVKPSFEDQYYMDWAGQKENKSNIIFSGTIPIAHDKDHQRRAMKMMIPVWQVSMDESHPVPTNKFSGLLVFVVDTTALIEKITKEIKSGKTGYAWVIDCTGTFLYHPERDFIGKNAFEARKERKPTISFEKINEIQKEKMLKGEEGTSWYISGWHRGKEREMKKLIAYAPIRLDASERRLWSVAVVAPISEVEDAIHSIQVRQFSLQAIIIVVILLGGLTVISLMVNWSRTLEHEVEKKAAEFIKSEQRYKLLVENAEDIIFTVDREGNILSINKSGAKFFNREVEDLNGRSLGEICFNEDSAFIQFKAIEEVSNTTESKQITYPVNIGADEYWISTNFNALLDEGGNVFAVLGIARDVTERKKREEQMYHTEKLASLGTLAAGVAHEINNPLAIILGFTDMLLEKTPHDSEFYDILKTIEKQGNNAKRVVENLLSFARYREPKEEDIDINKNLREVLTIVENTLSLKKIVVNKQMSEDLLMVKGDPREIQQVFFNIINNAISAMKSNGTLTVVTRATGDRKIEIRFSDTGHGIKTEHRSKVFDPLFTTKKVGEGTGLGLSVSYGIIAKYGGTITFETKTEEESSITGTTFIITLPAVKAVDSVSD